MTLEEEFKNPSQQYRIKPFWFWNGDMREEEIEHQIKEMQEKGLGGFFICARQGMSIPYLSQKWFEKVEFASKKAKEYGLEAWLYDEYPYPSGMSGGEVLLEHPEAKHMMLNHISQNVKGMEEKEIVLGWSQVIYAKAFAMKELEIVWEAPMDLENCIGNLQTTQIYQTTGLTKYNNKRFFTYGPQKILTINLPEGNWHIEIYTQSVMGDFKYYGGFFDPCNKAAVRTFLDTTHERYRKAIGEGFGEHIQGMFSDEVGLLSPIPWSKLLIDYFEEIKGYRIQDVMPALHNNSYENAFKIRYDLYDAMHKLFVESYHKQVSDWCKENHLYYATEVPSMRMSTQKYSTIVGGDTAHEKLGKSLEWIYDEYIRNYRSNAKSVSSLSRQLGNEFAMIESFHSVGWTMNMQDAKWMIDRLGASGINLYNFHAFYYTIDSITKHDAPPSQFLQNPYWKHYRVLADYVGRMGAFITNTEVVIKIAVLDPVASLWAYLATPFHGFIYKGEDDEERIRCDKLRDDWVYICKTLLFQQMDYDHLDAEIFENAIIENGLIKIGKATYELLIIPPSICIENTAYKKVKEFVNQGGKVIALGMLPSKSLGEEDAPTLWKELFRIDNSFENEYFNEVNDRIVEREHTSFFGDLHNEKWLEWCKRAVDIPFEIKPDYQNKKNIISTIRKDNEQNIYVFITNQGNKATVVNLVNVYQKEYNTKELFLENGEIETIDLEDNKVLLEPFQSRCIQFGKIVKENYEINDKLLKHHFIIDTSKAMKVRIEGKNILRFDQFEVSRNQINWSTSAVKTFIEQCADSACLESTDYKFEGEFGTPKNIVMNYPFAVYYRNQFEMKDLITNMWILMDKGTIHEDFELIINKCIIRKEDFTSTFVNDQNNIICDISKYITVGINYIEVKVMVTRDSDGIRDPLYLYGDFAVNKDKEGNSYLAKISPMAYFNLNYIEGYPYYSGTFDFETDVNIQDIDKDYLVRFDFENDCHECIEVFINGENVGVKAYTPYVWEVKAQILKKGANKVNFKLTNTLANMLDGTYFDYDSHQLIQI
ncbi:MAG: glycosyl hydrolase [Lachnotalea sp.]